MTPVMQTTRTNCVAACVASMFNLAIDQVPDFNPENWLEELNAWLRPMGLATINVTMISEAPISGYTLGAIDAASDEFPKDWQHCVVCKDGYVYFCPIDGLEDEISTRKALEYTVIYKLDPGEFNA